MGLRRAEDHLHPFPLSGPSSHTRTWIMTTPAMDDSSELNVEWFRRALAAGTQPTCPNLERPIGRKPIDWIFADLWEKGWDKLDASDLHMYYSYRGYESAEEMRYFFPACMLDWLRTFAQGTPCEHNGADVHARWLEDSLLSTGDAFFPALAEIVSRHAMAVKVASLKRLRVHCYEEYSWLHRMVSFGSVGPILPMLQEAIRPTTLGGARATLQILSMLVFEESENPLCLFDERLHLVVSDWDSRINAWRPQNLGVLYGYLDWDRSAYWASAAAATLSRTGEAELAKKIRRRVLDEREYYDEKRSFIIGQLRVCSLDRDYT